MLDLSNIELGFNILVAILLVATIAYAVILNKKLDALREAKAEMEGLILSFSETTAKAERSLAEFKAHASDTGSGLKENTAKADGILSDLSYLVDRAEVVADRLEEDLGLARQKSPETVLPKGVKPGEVKKDKKQVPDKEAVAKRDLSPAAEDLLKTLKGMR
ncbi:DUF6468 domain-containing protein [uncultured Kiloniella sp.]|uniref:DUF6468 domain-containing protein n=1 Tax=uncultured Kiloniella sp. TaxID=1133091 RepID=UPI00261736ED|nr:DUF6468 domain-containing protein [uncultured Kiloniella sp.]